MCVFGVCVVLVGGWWCPRIVGGVDCCGSVLPSVVGEVVIESLSVALLMAAASSHMKSSINVGFVESLHSALVESSVDELSSELLNTAAFASFHVGRAVIARECVCAVVVLGAVVIVDTDVGVVGVMVVCVVGVMVVVGGGVVCVVVVAVRGDVWVVVVVSARMGVVVISFSLFIVSAMLSLLLSETSLAVLVLFVRKRAASAADPWWII